jgi:hypothetical protein
VTTLSKSLRPLRRAFTKRHAPMMVVLSLGVALRVLAHLAYQYAFFYPDGEELVVAAYRDETSTIRPIGYSALLKPFVPGNLIWVAAVQHIMIICLAIACYLYLLRRSVRPWIGALALAPLVLGPSELMLEHYVLAEALFITLMVAALVALTFVGRGKRSTWAQWIYPGIAGLLLAAAALTRTVGLPIVIIAVVYLIIRVAQVGWRPFVAFGVAVVVPLVGYMNLYHHQHGVYAFSQYQGRFLYARSMTIADCSKLPASDQELCLPVDRADRPIQNDWYIWSAASPASIHDPTVGDDAVLDSFAISVFKAQPLDYAGMILRETSWYVVPAWRPRNGPARCRNLLYLPPTQPNLVCRPLYYPPGPTTHAPPAVQPVPPATVASRTLSVLGSTQVAYGPLTGLALLATLLIALTRLRRGDRALILDGVLFGTVALALMVISVATSTFELRYAAPCVPIAFLGLALVLRGARQVSVTGDIDA